MQSHLALIAKNCFPAIFGGIFLMPLIMSEMVCEFDETFWLTGSSGIISRISKYFPAIFPARLNFNISGKH